MGSKLRTSDIFSVQDGRIVSGVFQAVHPLRDRLKEQGFSMK